MSAKASIVLITLLCLGVQSLAQDWEAARQKRVDSLVQKNGPGTNQELKKRLLEMKEEDQAIRARLVNAPPERQNKIEKEMETIDRKLTAELKEIVRQHGWPTMRLVGKEGSQAASLILIHTADHDWQRECLSGLTRMVEQQEIIGDPVALITDKILVSEGKFQRFGTQFRDEGDHMVPEPVEDAAHLEERRARYLLPPMADYKKMLEEAYHKKIQPQLSYQPVGLSISFLPTCRA